MTAPPASAITRHTAVPMPPPPAPATTIALPARPSRSSNTGTIVTMRECSTAASSSSPAPRRTPVTRLRQAWPITARPLPGDRRSSAARTEAATAFAGAAERHGPIDVLVHVPASPDALTRTPLASLDEVGWDARGEAQLRAALWWCQVAHQQIRDRGGRIVLVTPTVGLVGSAGLVPYATAVEGMRALAKTAARQWGSAGITVNCVAPALEVFGVADAEGGPVPPAIGRIPTARADVAPVIAMLAGAPGHALTGTTIPVDGGIVMAP